MIEKKKAKAEAFRQSGKDAVDTLVREDTHKKKQEKNGLYFRLYLVG